MWIFLSPAKLHMLKIINHQLFVILSSLLITFSWKKNNICLSPIYFTQAHLFLVSFFFYKSLFLVSNLSFHCKIIFIVLVQTAKYKGFLKKNTGFYYSEKWDRSHPSLCTSLSKMMLES